MYIPCFIFWVEKQVSTTGQIRYQLQVNVRLHILGEKTYTYDRPSEVLVIDTRQTSYFE